MRTVWIEALLLVLAICAPYDHIMGRTFIVGCSVKERMIYENSLDGGTFTIVEVHRTLTLWEEFISYPSV
jgi:hypothetical protein